MVCVKKVYLGRGEGGVYSDDILNKMRVMSEKCILKSESMGVRIESSRSKVERRNIMRGW